MGPEKSSALSLSKYPAASPDSAFGVMLDVGMSLFYFLRVEDMSSGSPLAARITYAEGFLRIAWSYILFWMISMF